MSESNREREALKSAQRALANYIPGALMSFDAMWATILEYGRTVREADKEAAHTIPRPEGFRKGDEYWRGWLGGCADAAAAIEALDKEGT